MDQENIAKNIKKDIPANTTPISTPGLLIFLNSLLLSKIVSAI